MTVERTQGFHDEALIDYRQSPHLAQWPLFDRVAGFVVETVQGLPSTGAPPRVLELGAGHGGYVELLLALGCEVTVVDMSLPAVQRLDVRLGDQDRVIALHD
ncbi:MAG: Methyltransferase domain, partial [Gaiellales bacterium]|nr:Methyltransferase domain [Gaiellales bacterium]